MSLINKVLTDLDQRNAVDGYPNSDAESPLTGLPFTAVPQTKDIKLRYVLLSGVILVLAISVSAGAYFYTLLVNEKVASNLIIPVAKDKKAINNKPVAVKPPIKTTPVSQVKQLVTQKQAPPMPAAKPVENVPRSPPARVVKNKVQKTNLAMVNREPESQFKKNTIPLRSEQRAEVAYQSAYDQLKARNQRKAERSLRQALALDPGHIKSRELLSGVYIQQGRWVEASELLRNGLILSPGHRTFSKLYARSLMQLQQDKRAIVVLQEHAPPIKSDPEYYAILAALYQRQKDHASAVQTYQKIVAIQPRNGVWWVGLGISLEALGESKQASLAYFQARKSGNLQSEIAHFTNNRLVVLDQIGFPAQ